MAKIYINNNWEFVSEWNNEFCTGLGYGEQVRIPHTTKELPYNFTYEKDYQMVCGYRTVLEYDPSWKSKRVLINFEGVAHRAVVYVNGSNVAENNCGYTAFAADITDYLTEGSNLIAVKVDSRETGDIPPFGGTIDYLTYGGIYRNVYLRIEEKQYILDAYPEAKNANDIWLVHNTLDIIGESDKNYEIKYELYGNDNELMQSGSAVAGMKSSFDFEVESPILWDMENPYLYTIKYILGKSVFVRRFGIRSAEFRSDGFYLNNKKLKLRGLNRHQSFAYMGYAMPDSIQKNDADILKNELGVNIVRTSHYPQSQAFIDRCDEIGLLVFTEIPGWQHIGDAAWQDIAVENVKRMVKQYRHHPSVILWGVRINESKDNDALYLRTNEAAHKADKSRQTSGVRYLVGSSLLEDVYSHNDFSYSGGEGPGLKSKLGGVGNPDNMDKGYIVSEYNGHMFPTKMFDSEEHRLEHALRHAKVLEASYAQEDISGCIGWCMFDYNTHSEFGSGDRICYHGVTDMFRNKKLAAAVYASQAEKEPVLEIGCSMEGGDHPAGIIGPVWCFTNADSVKVYKNGDYVGVYFASAKFKNMPHPPVLVDDFVGCLLETKEGLDRNTSEKIKKCLFVVAEYGEDNLPKEYESILLSLAVTKKAAKEKLMYLYGKYVANWDTHNIVWRFDAIKDGEVVKSVTKAPATGVYIKAEANKTLLIDKDSWDAAAVRIRAYDNNGNPAHYFMEPLTLSAQGEIEIIGPDLISLKGGAGGTYVKTTGKSGYGKLIISSQGHEMVSVDFVIVNK